MSKINKIERPVVPMNIVGSEDRLNYTLNHFWDDVDFKDTVYMSNNKVFEQAFVDFVSLVDESSSESQNNVVFSKFLDKSEKSGARMFEYVTQMCEKYFYEPSSPFRSDETYEIILNFMLNSEMLDSLEKIRPKYQLDVISKNKIGEKISNFRFLTGENKHVDIVDFSADYLLLFFYNSDCEACSEVLEHMLNTPPFYAERLKVLLVGCGSEENNLKFATKELPENFLLVTVENGEKELKEMFDLRALPSLYLLSTSKHVIFKDEDVKIIEQYILDNEL